VAQAGSERAADALGRRRFLERLEARAAERFEAVTVHARARVQPAVRAEGEARAAHLRARGRREVVERAIARREAALRRELERRAEAAMDDRVAPPKAPRG
jgi:hypothetical protein